MNIIVEPGVVDEVKNYLPLAFTPPKNGISFLRGYVDETFMRNFIGRLMQLLL